MQLAVPQAIDVMQSIESNMTEQKFHDDESVHAGSKRRSPPTVHSDSDDLMEPSSPSSAKIVQTTKSKGIVNVQLFIRKAFAMINECEPSIASWTEEGDKFVVKNKEVFAATVIPQYYDHNNYSSFTRQLNFYGFTREQSMTIKVSDLNSLAVGQETFHHQFFQRGRPDLLKNLQRRTTDTKSSKKRKKPRTDNDMTYLQGKIESLEDTTREMMSTMKQMREQCFASASAIQTLQNLNVAKDEKISSLEKRIMYLERKLSCSSAVQRESSYIGGQRLLADNSGFGGGASSQGGLMKGWPQVAHEQPSQATNMNQHGQQHSNGLFNPSSLTFPANIGCGNINSSGVDDNNSAPTLARHPKMKKFTAVPPRDIFSYENASVNITTQPAPVPSRETSLDFGLFHSLARETSLLSWMPRQETEKTLGKFD